ncbi:MAG: hypothetical protein Q8N52_04955, partial [Acidobacteriota bacterium]|nr:hypothetical protein [Acidobacteriota bacterium]
TSEFSACRVVTAPLTGSLNTVSPANPSADQMATFLGGGLPVVDPFNRQRAFFTQGPNTFEGFVFVGDTSRWLVRLPPGLTAGAATITLATSAAVPLTAPMNMTIGGMPAAPVVTAVAGTCGGSGFLATANPGATIYVIADGFDTMGATVVFTPTNPPGAAVEVPVGATCHIPGTSLLSGPVVVPSFLNLTNTTVNVQMKQQVGFNTSPLSAAHSMTVTTSLSLVGPAGGPGGAPFGPYYCPAGFPANGVRVATNDTPINDIWGNVNYDVTAAELMCNSGSSTTKFGGGPTANTALQCAPGELLVGIFGGVDGAVLGAIGPRCQSPLGGPINQPWAARPAGGTPFTLDCAVDQVVVGVQGRQGAVLDNVSLICGPKP